MKKEIVISIIEDEIQKNIYKLGFVPEALIPKINKSNDFAYPYIEVYDDRIFYIVIEERGVEYRRDLFVEIDSLLKAIFEMITKSLAIERLKENRSDITSTVINQKQEELMKLLDYT